WSDGSPITAEDIRNAWLDLLTHTGAPYSSLLDIVAGAQDYRTGRLPRESVALSAPDPTTLTVRLVEPAGHLPQLLCHGALAAVKPDRTLSSGPFVVTAHTREALTLKKNEHYWDTDAVGFTEILIQRIDDDDEAAFQFNTGNVEWLMEHSAPAAILNADAVHITAEFATLFLFFRANGGIWDNSAMRAALLEAAPWEKLRAGFLLPATTLLYPLPGYPAVAGYDYTDPAEAARRMEAARAEAGKTSREPLTLTFAIQAGAAYLEPILYALREAWEPLGVQVLPQVVYGDYFSAIDTIQADLFVYNWIGDFADPLAFLELFRGGSSLNQSGWHNDAYDALLSEASRLSTNERYTALARAEQILLDSAEIMPLSHLISVHVINTNIVGGWSANAINIHPFKYLFRKPDNQRMPGII
ncbi:MAG: peptide ABC transporter substrate-binding protein, partial [Treponema sp.]|nr:peptide ABC transporter substrate-binding protein [Treponema sp.]